MKRPASLNPSMFALWGLALALGFSLLMRYELTPGRAAAAQGFWPREQDIPLAVGRPTLIVAVHPECPCSVASMNELAKLTARFPDRLACYVLFVPPPGMNTDAAAQEFMNTSLWKIAAATPGVTPRVDSRQQALQAFHAETSGTVLLYDAAGKLQFSGGITAARGHEGDNDGITSIESFLSTGVTTCASTPVFGCSLR